MIVAAIEEPFFIPRAPAAGVALNRLLDRATATFAETEIPRTETAAAVKALKDAGEVVNRGTDRRPLLHIAPKAVYFESRAPSGTGVDPHPYPRSNAAPASGPDARPRTLVVPTDEGAES